jgi:rare lipoprotein A
MKRKPWWSDRRRQAALLAAGLLWLGAFPAEASAGKPAGKPTVSRHTRTIKKTPHHAAKRHAGERQHAAHLAATNDGDAQPLSGLRALHGKASFYGRAFHGRKTTSGERFDMRQFTAASNHFPLGTLVAVHRPDNDRCAIVKINDRMGSRHRIIDVSQGVADYLDMLRAGVAQVRVAALPDDWQAQGLTACQAAFPPAEECESCGRPLQLSEFLQN